MKTTLISLFILLLTGFWALSAVAHNHGMMWRGSGGWGPMGGYCQMYDHAALETFKGEIASIDTFTPRNGMSQGVHLILKTEKENFSVHLGPAWYIENQDVKLQPGDPVEVTGSLNNFETYSHMGWKTSNPEQGKIPFNRDKAIMANEVKKGDNILKLRDENGFPYWSGWRRR